MTIRFAVSNIPSSPTRMLFAGVSKRWPVWVLCLFLVSACKPAPQPDDAQQAANTPPAAVEAKAEAVQDPGRPNLQIATLDHGQYDLSDKRGRWVVVNFWATWCSPCLKEMPELDAFDHARDDVDIIGLAYEEIAADDLRAFLKKHPVDYPIAIIDTYNPPADFDTPRGLPMTYVIAPDGKVAKTFMGPVTQEELAEIIDTATLRRNVANSEGSKRG